MTEKNAEFYVYMWLREKDSNTAKAGMPYYVGKGKGKRAYRKNGPKDKSNVIIIKSGLLEDDAFLLEKETILFYGRKDIDTGILINLSEGGEGQCGYRHTEETKAKIKNSCTGLTRSDSFKEGQRQRIIGENNPMYGRTLSDKERELLRIKMLGENNPFYGKHHSEESLKKIRDAKLGKKLTAEHIETIRANRIGRKHSEESKQKMRHPHKKPNKIECPYCNIPMSTSNIDRHIKVCKFNVSQKLKSSNEDAIDLFE